MSKIQNLKKKILKYNILSIYVILIFFILSSFFIAYFIVYEKYQTEIKIIQNNYIQNQKQMMEHQVNNIIKLINTLEKTKIKFVKEELKLFNNSTISILKKTDNKKYKFILSNLDRATPLMSFTLSDLKANPIYTSMTDYNKTKRINLIHRLLKNKKYETYFTHKTPNGLKITYQHIFGNYLLTTCTYQKTIDKYVKQRIIQVIYNIRFGPKNNGYISIAEILNYKGGKKFAKIIALPVNPKIVGKILSDDKKDAKGKLYRKEYLKIANTTGEGFVSYWFYKYSDKIIKPKISYIKLYKPWNWLIFTSVFVDDINNVLQKKEMMFKNEIRKLIILYIILFLIILLIARVIVEKENNIIKTLIEEYEDKINEKNEILKQNNIYLQTEVDKKTKELVTRMFTDNLTNLPNREKLLNDLNDNYVAIINIDDFKEINDFFGIKEGDRIIKEFGEFLNSLQITYKLSGDEFAIIAKTPVELRKKSTFIIEQLRNKNFRVNSQTIKLSVSIGIGKTLSEADTALKHGKIRKKSIIVYNKKLPILKEFEENLKWKKIINDAIENDNIIPYIQAIIDNKTKQISKYECLIRLKHKDKIYTPYFFLEIAKRTHQYETLQTIMVEKCFKKFSKLDYKFSINLSTKDLRNRQFLEFLIENIEKYNVAKQLTIELLEDEDLVKDERINKNILKLHNLGVNIAIDDFGSGYSNFIYLIKNLPINTLKIDGTLIKDILKDEKLFKLLQKIVEIANTFNFETIGEFVENEEIYNKLKTLNIDASQGYYFSKPFDMNDLN